MTNVEDQLDEIDSTLTGLDGLLDKIETEAAVTTSFQTYADTPQWNGMMREAKPPFLVDEHDPANPPF